MLVDAGYFRDEPLLPLLEACKGMNPPRTKQTLWAWHRQGNINASGDRVEFHVASLPSGFHTSREEIARHLRAITNMSIKAQVVGGTQHGMTLVMPDTDKVLTPEDFDGQLGGRIVPADECYEPLRFIDSRGKVRTFLVFKELPNGSDVVIGMLEKE